MPLAGTGPGALTIPHAATIAQQSDDDVSGSTALLIFLVVMVVVVSVLVVIQRRRRNELRTGGSFEQRERADEEARQLSFEQKMRRVEERLRATRTGDQDSHGDSQRNSDGIGARDDAHRSDSPPDSEDSDRGSP